MKITIDVDDALHARLRDAAEGGDLSVEEVALVLVARGIRDAYGDSTQAARLDAKARLPPVVLTREQVRDLLVEGREGRRAMEERIARRPPVTDDSGRESREPARMTEGRVRSLLEAATPGPWEWRDPEDLRTLHERGEYRYGGLVLHAHEIALDEGDRSLIEAAPDIARAYLAACAERDRYDAAQMRAWDALREAYAIVAAVEPHVAKYERDASTLLGLVRALVTERDALRAEVAAYRAAKAARMEQATTHAFDCRCAVCRPVKP